jgi:hypothetical protein
MDLPLVRVDQSDQCLLLRKMRDSTVRDHVHLERIAPGQAPGRIYVRLCTLDALLSEHALSEGNTEKYAAADAILSNEQLDRGQKFWLYFYDGDSGECIGTITNGL